MSAPTRRSRSTTAASQRPPSRDSTTSIHSAPTHLAPADPAQAYSHADFPSQHVTTQHQISDQFSATSASILQNAVHGLPQHSFDSQSQGMGMNLDSQMGVPFQNHDQNAYYQQQPIQYNQQQQPMDYNYNMQPHQPAQAVPASLMDNGETKKRGSASSQTNDKELREMLRLNHGRTLSDVAKEVLTTERTSRAEKSKQLFAMIWLGNACQLAKASVPRSRVYTTYAERCANERVQPLNPASFGKLVRVIFPGIQTRRLGVRGESKYHYVDLALVDDQQEGEGMRPRSNTMTGGDGMPQPRSPKSASLDFSSIPRLDADTALLPTDDHSFASPTLAPRQLPPHVDGRIFADPVTPGFYPPGLSTSNSYEQRLAFAPPEEAADSDVIDLPDIWYWAPPKTDVDAADALMALYRTHCTSLVDCVRFCKEKQFYRLFNSFQGTLTVPVQKLFVHPSVAPWVKECDWHMYQKMLNQLYGLTLQVLPVQAMKFLDGVSRGLHSHITRTFQGLPQHVLEAKLEPATLFCELVSRMLKVNQTAHAAARVLETTDFREMLWQDWVKYINPKRLMESELPGCGYEETYKILTQDVLSLLQPLKSGTWSGDGTHYQDMDALRTGEVTEPLVDRIGMYLLTLPSRFPRANARTLVDCIKNISTAAVRDMTIGGAPTFNAWWIIKVYIDEMSQWLASSGGFLAHRPPKRAQSSPPLSNSGAPLANGIHDASGAEESQQHSRYSSVGAEFAHSGGQASAYRPTSDNSEPQQMMMQPQIESTNYFPPQGSKKRGSNDDAAIGGLNPPTPGKKMKYSQDTQPAFEQPQASFTTSFASLPDTRPASADDMHDDSGIGLGLFDDNFDASKEQPESLNAVQYLGEDYAVAINDAPTARPVT